LSSEGGHEALACACIILCTSTFFLPVKIASKPIYANTIEIVDNALCLYIVYCLYIILSDLCGDFVFFCVRFCLLFVFSMTSLVSLFWCFIILLSEGRNKCHEVDVIWALPRAWPSAVVLVLFCVVDSYMTDYFDVVNYFICVGGTSIDYWPVTAK